MKHFKLFIQSLHQKGKSQQVIQTATELLTHFLQEQAHDHDNPDFVRNYTAKHIAGSEMAVNKIIILFWYHDFIQDKASATYLVTLLGTLEVIENQKSRMQLLYGDEAAEQVFGDVSFPPIGSDIKAYPDVINKYLDKTLKILGESGCKHVLAGNHHDVSTDGFLEDKSLFAEKENLHDFLAKKHARLVENLRQHSETGKLWFEQYISPAVVEYVRNHQEIQTGVIEGNRIIVQKIPYNPDAWLQATDPVMKRYYACHCPFARDAIKAGKEISSLWCYCSGGYTKLFFDFIFEQELEVELLESVLAGAETCKFAIKLPDSYTEGDAK